MKNYHSNRFGRNSRSSSNIGFQRLITRLAGFVAWVLTMKCRNSGFVREVLKADQELDIPFDQVTVAGEPLAVYVARKEIEARRSAPAVVEERSDQAAEIMNLSEMFDEVPQGKHNKQARGRREWMPYGKLLRLKYIRSDRLARVQEEALAA